MYVAMHNKNTEHCYVQNLLIYKVFFIKIIIGLWVIARLKFSVKQGCNQKCCLKLLIIQPSTKHDT